MELTHIPVLFDECMDGLAIKPDGQYADYTLGRAGHSQGIVSQLDTGRLFCFDRDGEAIDAARQRLAQYADKVTLIRSDFRHAAQRLAEMGVTQVDGILMDIGVSSPQIDNPERGFSYMHDAKLDMRMDCEAQLSAHTVVNTYERDMLRNIISNYGEERYAGRIADKIVASRPVDTTLELVEVIKSALPAKALYDGGHPAIRTFQAIRIEVNDELNALKMALDDALKLLNPGGRLCCITFHSLEDRIVKDFISDKINGCTCPSDFPRCVCGFMPEFRKVTRKPITSGAQELTQNPRARSAKLRVAEKI